MYLKVVLHFQDLLHEANKRLEVYMTGTCPAVGLTTDVYHPRAQCRRASGSSLYWAPSAGGPLLLAALNFCVFFGGGVASMLNSGKKIKKKRT